jgi:hypothetical protein
LCLRAENKEAKKLKRNEPGDHNAKLKFISHGHRLYLANARFYAFPPAVNSQR